MVFLAIIGGLIGGPCILIAAFIIIAESLGWRVRRYGATPMWRTKKKRTSEMASNLRGARNIFNAYRR
jgi:hypothetical protein